MITVRPEPLERVAAAIFGKAGSANMLSIILDPAPTGDRAGVAREVETFVAWRKGSLPLAEGGEVMVPGDPERRARKVRANGVPLDDTTWRNIVATACGLGISEREVDHLLQSNH